MVPVWLDPNFRPRPSTGPTTQLYTFFPRLGSCSFYPCRCSAGGLLKGFQIPTGTKEKKKKFYNNQTINHDSILSPSEIMMHLPQPFEPNLEDCLLPRRYVRQVYSIRLPTTRGRDGVICAGPNTPRQIGQIGETGLLRFGT